MELFETLEKDLSRILELISNCDNKASIILGAVFTVISLVLGLCGRDYIVLFSNHSGSNCIIFVLLVLAAIVISLGIIEIMRSIQAKIDYTEYNDDSETIFFGKISLLTLEQYREKVLLRDNSSYIRDLTAQIHTCSVICQRKYECYNRGLFNSVLGCVFLIGCSVLAISV